MSFHRGYSIGRSKITYFSTAYTSRYLHTGKTGAFLATELDKNT
jgi:hypothetical protein